MELEKLEYALRQMSNRALIKFVKRCVCQTLPGVRGQRDAEEDSRGALDMVYVECSRRGKEHLYDTAYAYVAHHPDRCNIS